MRAEKGWRRMRKYHGDINQFGQSFYRTDESGQIIVAVILLLLLGFTGAHRFYLGETRHGMFHLGLCFVAVIFGIFTFNFRLAFAVFGIQALILLFELVFFFVRAAMGR